MQLTGDFFLVDHDDHPDADFLVAAQQRCAVDPAGLAFDVSLGAAEPGDFRGDARSVCERVEEAFAYAFGTADAFEEFGLQEAGDAEGGGGEGYAEGGVGADEEVLYCFWSVVVLWFGGCYAAYGLVYAWQTS